MCEGLENKQVKCSINNCILIKENDNNLNALEVIYNDVKKRFNKIKNAINDNDKEISNMNRKFEENAGS
jgi:hypothetical protein